MLHIQHLSASVDQGSTIINNLSLLVSQGSTHAIMGPNGSGKSTLAHVIMGHPAYTITGGTILYNEVDLCTLSVDARARMGLFLALQHPYVIPGMRIMTLLKESCRALRGNSFSIDTFIDEVKSYCNLLSIEYSMLERSLNDGFSGGEKKKLELLQMLIHKPRLVILDEIDSGLDVDALAVIGRAVTHLRNEVPSGSIMVITHYQRILTYIVPDYVHIMYKGSIVASGTMSLVHTIEMQGYNAYR